MKLKNYFETIHNKINFLFLIVIFSNFFYFAYFKFIFLLNFTFILLFIYSYKLIKFHVIHFLFFLITILYFKFFNIYIYKSNFYNFFNLYFVSSFQLFILSFMFLLSFINFKKICIGNVIKKKKNICENLFFILCIFTTITLIKNNPESTYFYLSRMQLFELDANLTCFFLITFFYLFSTARNYFFFFIPALFAVILTGSRTGFLYLLLILVFSKYRKIINKIFFTILILILFLYFFLSMLINLNYDVLSANFNIISFSKKYLIDSTNVQSDGSFFFYLMNWGPFRIVNIFDISSFWKFSSFGVNINEILKDYELLFFPYKYYSSEIISKLLAHNLLINIIFELSLPVSLFVFYFLYSLSFHSNFIKVIIAALVLSSMFLGSQTLYLLMLIMLILIYTHIFRKLV